MRKILSTLLAISFLAIAPLAVSAQSDNVDIDVSDSCNIDRNITINENPCPTGNVSLTGSGDGAMCCLVNSIYNIVDWIFIILVALAGVFIIIGAMNIIIAGGDSGKVDTGRKYIMYAAIGLFVAFIARAIPSIVVNIVG
ncbi:MAG: hypothetical protein WC302_01560 [Candidatus Paceibacterota bacterium]|jgi:hypothetical protein